MRDNDWIVHAFSPFHRGLRSRRVLATTMDRRPPGPNGPRGAARPQRPDTRAGNLETRSLLPQRQARRLPVRHRPERSRPYRAGRQDPLHAPVRRQNKTVNS